MGKVVQMLAPLGKFESYWICVLLSYTTSILIFLLFLESSFYSGNSGGGGGSGGSISLSSCTIESSSSSLVQANGGAGGKSRYSFNVYSNCGGGGGGGGVIKTKATNNIGGLVLQVDGGARPSSGRKKGEAGSAGVSKTFCGDGSENIGQCLTTSSPKHNECLVFLV